MVTIYYKDNELNKWKTVRSLVMGRLRGLDTNIIVESSYDNRYVF